MRFRTARVLCLSVASLALAATASPIAASASATKSAPPAFVRGAHLSPDTAGVDVYLTAFSGGTQALWLSDVGYGDVSKYRSVAAGTYAVSMRPHGAAKTTKPVLTWTVSLKSGHAYTAAAIGMNAKLHGVILSDTLNRPSTGTGLVRVVQASSRGGTVSVSAGGKTLSSSVPFGLTTGYVAVPRGTWTVQASSKSDPGLTGRASVTIGNQSINSVVVLDAKTGGLAVHPLLDAAGAQSTPKGAIDAGGGGTATEFTGGSSSGTSATEIAAWGGAGALLTLGLGMAVARRRTSAASA